MRHVFNTSEVPHIWAQRSQQSGRGGNLFFEGDSIYSYGRHFEIARFVARKKQTVVLLTTRTYSHSTSSHVSMTWRAVSHQKIFHVPLANETSKNNPRAWFEYYRGCVDGSLEKASRARKNREWYFNSAIASAKEGNEFAEYFGLRQRITLPENIDEAIAAAKERDRRQREKNAAQERKRQQQRERREAEARKQAIIDLDEWRTGGIDRTDFDWALGYTALRLTANGADIQTSKGARFPIEHGQRAYEILKRLHDRQESYQRNGHTIHCGHYSIDSLDTSGIVRAGCHTLAWEEIERLATIAGWTEKSAPEKSCA
jgi:hypothetical protein